MINRKGLQAALNVVLIVSIVMVALGGFFVYFKSGFGISQAGISEISGGAEEKAEEGGLESGVHGAVKGGECKGEATLKRCGDFYQQDLKKTGYKNCEIPSCDIIGGYPIDVWGGGHVTETVGWIAVNGDNPPFDGSAEAGVISTSSSQWKSVDYLSFSDPPVVLAEQLTESGGEELEIDEVKDIESYGADVRFCELESGDECDSHAGEHVGWLALEEGDVEIGGVIVGKSGIESADSGEWVDPGGISGLLVVGTGEKTGDAAGLIFEANMSGSSPKIRICDSNGGGGPGCQDSGSQTFHYLALNATKLVGEDNIEAGTLEIDGGTDSVRKRVDFSKELGSSPLVFASVQTANGKRPVEVKLISVDSGGFRVSICHQDFTNGCFDSHDGEGGCVASSTPEPGKGYGSTDCNTNCNVLTGAGKEACECAHGCYWESY